MSLQTDPRFRINAKQTVKGVWQFDATFEYKDDKIKRSTSDTDAGQTVSEPLGLRLLSMIKEAEKAFKEDGRALAGDNDE